MEPRGKLLVALWIAIVSATVVGLRAAGQQSAAPQAYICPMHPDVVARTSGACPRCGMGLAPADPYDTREFLVAVDAVPAAPIAGRTTRLRLTIKEPATRAIVRELVEVNEKRYHLFVVSQDLDHYDHLHPERQADGSYLVEVMLPHSGYYKLYSDFLPLGAVPQIVPGVLVTAGVTTSLASARARLAPDAVLTRTVGGMRVTLTLPPDGLVAGRDEKLHYQVADADTGAPVTDIEPYLAAFGHAFALTEDTLHYVHAHPMEKPDAGASPRAGPELTFKALMPTPGRYRMWTQLKRGGVVSTVAFTVAVASPAVR